MNPESPTPREQVEARLTALLLGELSADEAAALREVIARDPQLAALHDRMKQTIALVRETALEPAEAKLEAPAPMRLSDAKREKLLAQFKTVKPVEFVRRPQQWRIPRLNFLRVAALVAVLVGLPAIIILSMIRPRFELSDNIRPDTASTPTATAPKTSSPQFVNGTSEMAERKLVVSPQQREQLRSGLAEPTGQELAKKEVPADSRARETAGESTNVYSEHVVGYVNVSQAAAPATPAATPSTTIVLPSTGETAQEKTLAAADSLPPGPHLIHEYLFNDSAPVSASNSVVAQGNNLVPTLQHRWTFVSTDGSVAAPVVSPTTLGVIVSTNYQTAQSSDFVNGGVIVAGTPVSEPQLQAQNSFYRDLNSASNVGPGQNQVALDGSVPGALNSVLRNVNKDDTGASRYFQNGDVTTESGRQAQMQAVPGGERNVASAGTQPSLNAGGNFAFGNDVSAGLPQSRKTDNGVATGSVQAATLVQDGRFLYEAGKYDEAEAKLKQALALDPADVAAQQYQQLITERRAATVVSRNATASNLAIQEVSQAWNVPGVSGKGGEQLRERDANKTVDQGISLPTGVNASRTASESASVPQAQGFNWTLGAVQNGAASAGSSEVASTPTATGPGGAGGGGFGGRAGRGRAGGGRGGGGGANGGGISGGGGRSTIVASAGTQPSLTTGAAVPTQYAKAADITPALDQLAAKDKSASQLSGTLTTTESGKVATAMPAAGVPQGALAQRAQTVQQNMNGATKFGGGAVGTSTASYPDVSGPVTVTYDAETNSIIYLAQDGRTADSVSNLVTALDSYKSYNGRPDTSGYEVRNFQVNPNKFIQGLEGVAGKSLGGTAGGGVGGRGGNGGSGIQFVSGSDSSAVMSQTVRAFFNAAGVPLNSNTAVFFDDRKGTLTVRGTSQDLDLLQAAVETFSPPTNKPIIEARLAEDRPMVKSPTPPLEPQPEVLAATNAFSTFSLNVSDVSFKLAQASLARGLMPDAGSVRSEEFINAFDYRDPAPAPGAPIGFAAERAHYPFAHNRDLLRFSVKTAASGREAGRPLNLVLVLDNSGSMERADRVAIIHEAMKVLASQLQQQDTISVVTFARTARLWVDGIPGLQAGQVLDTVGSLTPEGGTDLGQALDLGYATAHRHYLMNGVNRVVLLTDGAANLGNVDANALKAIVEAQRKQGIDLDCFGIGWEGYNDDLLEVLTRNGDGRYGFINTPEEAASGFASQLAGALRVAASDVKVQVEFNPARVISYRQIGYAKHQLTKEQFRDNTVAAAQIGAAEAGNALYTVELNPNGSGPVCTVHVRYRDPGTANYYEHAWDVSYNGEAVNLDQASPAMRLAATAAAFSEWLGENPFAVEVTPDALLKYLNGVPAVYGADTRPAQLETMIREAKSATGK